MLKEEGSLDPPNHHMGVMTDMESTIMERGGTIETGLERMREMKVWSNSYVTIPTLDFQIESQLLDFAIFRKSEKFLDPC